MKTPSNELFELIKSLSKTEKRYFKVYLENNSFTNEHIYLKLFDGINEQKEYNEDSIKHLLKQNQQRKNFKKIKLNLSIIILKCLDLYHSETAFESIFKNQFKIIHILYQKGLYNQCRKNIYRLKKQLLLYERNSEIIEICRFEKRLPVYKKSTATAICLMEKEAINNLNVEISIKNLSDKVFETIKINEHERDPENRKKYKTLLRSPLLNRKEIPASFRARYYYYNAFSFIYSVLNLQEECYRSRKIQLSMFKKHPQQVTQYPELHISSLHNFLISCFLTKRIKEYYIYLNEMKKMEEKYNKMGNARLATSIFVFAANHEFTSLGYLGQFERVYKLAPQLEEKLKQYADGVSIQIQLTLYYGVAYAFFGAGDYTKALVWINKIINHPKVELRHDIQSFARILNLIIHYEMGNTDFLDSTNRAAQRFINKRGRLYKYESLILNFIKKIYSIRDRDTLVLLFKLFKKQLLKLAAEPSEKSVFEEFDIYSWLESKIENRSFADVIKRKALQKKS
jgi:hypothetical protein